MRSSNDRASWLQVAADIQVPRQSSIQASRRLHEITGRDLPSAKCEGKCLHSSILKLDHEGMVSDPPLLPDQLIQAMVGHHAVALRVRVHAVILSRRLPVHGHSKADWLSIGACTEHKVQVTSMEAKGDLSSCGLEHSGLAPSTHFPASPHWFNRK